MLQNIYLILQNALQNIGCIYSGPCQSDDQCTGNSGADVCVKSEPSDTTGECGM